MRPSSARTFAPPLWRYVSRERYLAGSEPLPRGRSECSRDTPSTHSTRHPPARMQENALTADAIAPRPSRRIRFRPSWRASSDRCPGRSLPGVTGAHVPSLLAFAWCSVRTSGANTAGLLPGPREDRSAQSQVGGRAGTRAPPRRLDAPPALGNRPGGAARAARVRGSPRRADLQSRGARSDVTRQPIEYEALGNEHFDLVLVYDGINEARANNVPPDLFRDDYGHYGWYEVVNALARHQGRARFALPYTAEYLGLRLRELLLHRATSPETQSVPTGSTMGRPCAARDRSKPTCAPSSRAPATAASPSCS